LEFRAPDERVMLEYCGQYLQRLASTFSVGQLVRESVVLYLGNLQVLLGDHFQTLVAMQRNSNFATLYRGKFVVQATLGPRVFEEFCEAEQEVFCCATLIQKFAGKLDRGKTLSDHNMIQRMNF